MENLAIEETKVKRRGVTSSDEQQYKRRLLCVAKPSYLLGLGPKASRKDYLKGLPKLLTQLLRQRHWKEASRVLSVLMQGTLNDSSPKMNRLKYEAHIQIVSHLYPKKNMAEKIADIYDSWIGKIGKQHKEERLLVWFHQICHFIEHGMADEASSTVISLMQNRDFGMLPRSNYLLESRFTRCGVEFQSDNAECNESISIKPDYSLESEGSSINESETSVGNYKSVSSMYVSDSGTSMDIEDKVESPQHFTNPPQLYSATSDDNEVSLQDGVAPAYDPTLIKTLGNMDPWLLPLKPPEDPDCYIRMVNDSYYKEAVRYMRVAVQSPRHVALPALHPLIQLLLIGGHVDEAIEVVEQMCNKVHDIKSLRIKALLMEKFLSNSYLLSKSYEDIVKLDPNCLTTLKKLIGMCKEDKYSKESLVEMIALHVEASFPEPVIWEEFASCLSHFFKNLDEDRMSVCFFGSGEKGNQQTYSVRYNPTPKMFTDTSWTLRAKCWLYRHFSPEMLETEMKNCNRTEDREWKMVTYKAACATHIYGREFDYVTKVLGLLKEKSKYRYLYNSLQEHRENGDMIYNLSN